MGEDRRFFSCVEVDVVVEAFALDQKGRANTMDLLITLSTSS
jgi:hypothetical protein